MENKNMHSILVVDDVSLNLQLIGKILNRDEYNLAFATSGLSALQMLDNTQPDIILLDIMMPEMDGIETCKRIKENEKTAGIPIMFLTALSETEHIVKGFEVGAVDYITKPINPPVLLARVKTHLELKKIRDEQTELIHKLEESLAEVKQLSGLLPICSSCKKIRNDDGYWEQVEHYITTRLDTKFSHGICPDCRVELYPDFFDSDGNLIEQT